MASRSIVGLEIAEHWVRGVELTRPGSRKPVVRAVGEVALPEGAALDSEVLDNEAVAVALTQLWSQAGFKSKEVVLGVGNRRVLVREYVAPDLPLEQIKQALRFQVQDLLPVPVEQAVLDFYPVEPTTAADGSPAVSGLLVSAVSDNIQGLLNAISSAKLKLVGVDLAPFGLARIAARVAQPGVRSLVINVGASTSWFVVVEDSVPRFVRIVPAGLAVGRVADGHHRLQAPAAAPGVPVAAPEPEPVSSPFPGMALPASDGVAEAPADQVQEFITWFTGTRDFYERAHPEHPLRHVLLTGEGSLHEELVDRLRQVSDVGVETFGLNDAFAVANPSGDLALDCSAITAAGVAIGGEQ